VTSLDRDPVTLTQPAPQPLESLELSDRGYVQASCEMGMVWPHSLQTHPWPRRTTARPPESRTV
jgi:hypothetical protein